MPQLCDGHNYPALFCCRELLASFNLIPISHLAVDGRLIIEAPVDFLPFSLFYATASNN